MIDVFKNPGREKKDNPNPTYFPQRIYSTLLAHKYFPICDSIAVE